MICPPEPYLHSYVEDFGQLLQLLPISKSEVPMLRIDSYFTNGKVNKTCQDYVIHGETPVPYVILCDGCSSSRFTDVGARILAHSAKEALNVLKPFEVLHTNNRQEYWDDFGHATISFAKGSIKNLGLPNESLDATLMIMFYIEEEKSLRCLVYGDGCIVFLKDNYPITIYNFSFEGNAPYYLTYRIDPERRKLYENFVKDLNGATQRQIITFTDGREYPFCRSTSLYNKENVLDCDIGKVFNGALLCSDGISSFVNFENAERVDVKHVAEHFTAFKNFNGEFIKRRIRRAMEDMSKNQIHNTDDVSVGGIIFNG